MQNNNQRIVCENENDNCAVLYCKPKNVNEYKRYGKYLQIKTKNFFIKLNGRQINTIVNVLKKVGEFNGRIQKETIRGGTRHYKPTLKSL